MKQPHLIFTAAALLALCGSGTAQTPSPSIDEEIARLQKELIKTQVDCRQVSEDIKSDRKDFESYRIRTEERRAQQQALLDTLKLEIAGQQRINDSLASQVNSCQNSLLEIELSQEEFRRSLIAICKNIQPFAASLPPLSAQSALSALSLLSGDLAAKSIDIVEGCSRMTQLLNRLDETGASLQIVQESSPVSDIRGMVYRLRIGSFFEAVVDVNGKQCALFEGWNGDGAPKWKTLADQQTAQAIFTAVNIREGRALPAFVNIPLAPATLPQGGL